VKESKAVKLHVEPVMLMRRATTFIDALVREMSITLHGENIAAERYLCLCSNAKDTWWLGYQYMDPRRSQ
jgi:hypothetical protein